MKIAVLSDIHANLQALEAVLKDIQEQGCEKVFCLGDLAMAGPEPSKVVNKIKHDVVPFELRGSDSHES